MRILLSLVMLVGASLSHGEVKPGKLLIVGGALRSDNQQIYRAFIDNLPNAEGKVAIVPVASGRPVTNAEKFKKNLISFGMKAENITVLPLAVRDDKETEFDESTWRENANNAEVVAKLKDIAGFWFVGGDQMRIVETLLAEPDQPSLLLKLLRIKLSQGAVIGGSSAGAAMMSQPMIAAGDSFNALATTPGEHYYGMESQEYGVLYLHHGLGFFPYGLVDQHFDRKARLGRLIRALAETGVQRGYAVDEDTGMLIDLAAQTLQVVGAANVTIVDASTARFTKTPFAARELSLTVLSPGDIFDLESHVYLPIDDTPSTVGNEYASGAPHQGAGMALANHRLDQLLGYELLDNSDSQEVRRYSFLENGQGFRYRFIQLKNSEGYWRYTSGSKDQYSIINVRMDVEPVAVKVTDRN